MVNLPRGLGIGSDTPAPIARSFALVVLAALLLLVILRRVFGSVRLEVGTH